MSAVTGSKPLLFQPGHPEQAAQEHVQMALTVPKDGNSMNSLGNLCQCTALEFPHPPCPANPSPALTSVPVPHYSCPSLRLAG